MSRDGEVQSRWSRTVHRTLTETWLPLKPVACPRYLSFNLSAGGRKQRHYIHRLVLEAFAGPPPEGSVCRHLDGDRTNNRLHNLAWGTYPENEQDKWLHGTWLVGEQINAKLTEADVLEIRRLSSEGKTFAELAAAFGVTPQNVAKIIRREFWRHLP